MSAVITGVGLVTPLGVGREASWEGIKAGRSGVGPEGARSPLHEDGSPRAVALALCAAEEAWSDAGCPAGDPERRSCVVSSSKPLLDPFASRPLSLSNVSQLERHSCLPNVKVGSLPPGGGGPGWGGTRPAVMAPPILPFRPLQQEVPCGSGPLKGERNSQKAMRDVCSTSEQVSDPNHGRGLDWLAPESVPLAVARRFGAEGIVLNISSACATGAHSLLTAAGWIEEGRADVVLAGAAESSLHPLYLAGFHQMGVLSPAGRVRPFDAERDGFVVGEGAAVFVVESSARARARGARAYATIAGGDFSSDAHHAVRFNAGGAGMAAGLERAIRRAGLRPEDLNYVNAHGTGTVLNDEWETRALLSVFGGRTPPVSSTKGATGHLLGATGAVEIAFTVLAMRDGLLPPTINLERPLTDRIDFVPRARPERVRRAASVSFGFGGAMAFVVLTEER